MNTYAGIGSRETPKDILALMFKTAKYLAENGYILRSGGAEGADTAFEQGCDNVKGNKEIFLPWKGFNNNQSNLYGINTQAIEIAKKYHPAPDKLSQGAMKLQARNCYQVLGKTLDNPCKFVICYTKERGGTTQALRIAKDYNIPVYNWYNRTESLKAFLEHYM